VPFDEAIAEDRCGEGFTFADVDRAVQYSYVIEPPFSIRR
jgi:hypothetical protein